MPSVMVLVLGKDFSLATVADAVVAGAKSVRFTEVTTRAIEPDVFRYRVFDVDASLSSFDGVVVVASDEDSTISVPKALTRLSHHGAVVDTVLGRVGGGTALVADLVATGGIVVSSSGEATQERARATGERVAKIAGWVRHALGHEAGEEHAQHHHDREHDHHHDHHHDQGQHH